MTEVSICADCGAELAAEAKFCSQCGTPVEAAPHTPARGRSDLDAVFAHLRSGEQRPATILMTDLTGFTALGESADPEWLYEMINDVFEELVECLVAHGAHIDKYMGDEIMALFGVPVAQERSVERALRAALALQDRLNALNEEDRFGGQRLELHTGINVGPVMVGPVGHRRHADYTVIGDAVNIAKRLEDDAPSGHIHVSAAVRHAVRQEFEFEPMGMVTLSGRSQEVEVFRLVGATHAGPRRSHADAGPLLGRDAEMAALRAAGERAAAGEQVSAYLVGPAGIGKSRIVHEWCDSADAEGFTVLDCTCHAIGQRFPLLALVEIVSQLLGLRLEGWPARVVGDIDRALQGLAQEGARETLRRLLSTFGGAPDDPDTEWVRELGPALSALLADTPDRGPTCLVLEDLQWLDEPTAQVLLEVLGEGREWPLLVIASSREPIEDPLPMELSPEIVALTSLSARTMAELVRAWAAPDMLPERTVEAICDRSQGHPYFARELVGTLRADASATHGSGLPHTLQELFLTQLDWLPIPLRRLVQAASVLGEPMSPDLLVAAMGDEMLDAGLLAEAVDAELIHPGPGPDQYVYARRLLFEAAYTTIPPNRRRSLHGRIAQHIITNRLALGAGAVHMAAHHAFLGFGDERAVELLIESAQRYHRAYATRQAIQDAGRATSVISSLEDPTSLGEQRLEALWILAQSYEVTGDLGHAEGALAEAEILAEECANRELTARIALSSATLRLMQGETNEAERQFARARDVWRELGDPTREAHALLGMGMCAHQAGETARGLGLYEEAANVTDAALWVRAAALNNAGMVLLHEGHYAEAEPLLAEGLDANERDGDRRGIAHSRASLGELYFRMGRFAEAEDTLRDAQAEAKEIEDAQCRALSSAVLARTHAATGNLGLARMALEEVSVESTDDAELSTVAAVATVDVLAISDPGAPADTRVDDAIEACDDQSTDSASPACLNARVELSCLRLEAAMRQSDADTTTMWREELLRTIDTAPDRHLRRYAKWLAEGCLGEIEPAGERTVFDVRADALNDVAGSAGDCSPEGCEAQ